MIICSINQLDDRNVEDASLIDVVKINGAFESDDLGAKVKAKAKPLHSHNLKWVR